jgi:nucleotide-binding universal stress UspA family protein
MKTATLATPNPEIPYLKADALEATPRLAHLLSADFAWRYHVLPVAQNGERVTVAMADPENSEARQAIFSTFGSATCVVQSDAALIDEALAEIWPEYAQQPPRFLVWAPPGDESGQILPYARSLAELLRAQLDLFESNEPGERGILALTSNAGQRQANLIIFHPVDPPLLKRLVLQSDQNTLIEHAPTSLLITRQPRWPIRRVLLVIRGEERDTEAVHWALRLGRCSGAVVTVLPLVMSLPALYRDHAQMQQSLPVLLATDTPLGRKLRWAARRLVEWEVQGTLRLREGEAGMQIRQEMLEGDYDLVVIAAEAQNRLWRWLLGELINPLLHWADCPILIVKSKQQQ